MNIYAEGDSINDIEVRCKGKYKDGSGIMRPCTHMFFIGSPGFDIYGKPKVLEIKCPSCGTVNIITSVVEEKVIVKVKE